MAITVSHFLKNQLIASYGAAQPAISMFMPGIRRRPEEVFPRQEFSQVAALVTEDRSCSCFSSSSREHQAVLVYLQGKRKGPLPVEVHFQEGSVLGAIHTSLWDSVK